MSNNPEKNVDLQNSTKKSQYVNMTFTDENYNFIVAESSKLNAHFSSFLNLTISSIPINEILDFIAKNPIRKSKSLASKKTGEHLKRIYFKLSSENLEKIHTCSEQNNSSNTVIVNVILEIYRQK